jgi:S-adenosylmethionine uptake transporter
MRTPHPILLVCFGVIFGCGVDAVMKAVMLGGTGVLTATTWRYILGAVIMITLFVSAGRRMPTLEAIRFHALRSLAQVISAFFFFYSLTQIALAEAVVLGFTAALMIAPTARIILGEKMSPVTIIASLIGFCGAALAATAETTGAPADGNRVWGVGAILISAVLYAVNIVLLRLRSRQEDSLTLVTFMNILPALFLLPFMLAFDAPLPETQAWPMMVLVAFFGIGIWWLMTMAYGRAKAQTLAPFEYTGLIWSALLGYVFFQEIPGWRVYGGAAIIIAACLVVAFDTHFAARRQARMPVSDIVV